MVFYVLSELIPFLHKQGFVLMRLKPYVENLVVAIDDLIYGLTGCKLRDDEIKNGEGVYSLIIVRTIFKPKAWNLICLKYR